jgi:peptide/nickel transport system substrate-binding protein
VAAEIQAEAYASVPYITIGQFDRPTAYRSNLTGYVAAPLPILWSIDKQ